MSVVQGDDITLADLVALNYTILVPYNASIPTGGDSLHDNLNLYYTVCDGVGTLTRKRISLITLSAVGRSRMDYDFRGFGASDDPRCWVRNLLVSPISFHQFYLPRNVIRP